MAQQSSGNITQLQSLAEAVSRPLHIVMNGWFLGRPDAGSGQYLHHLLAYLPQRAPQHRYTLLVPRAALDEIAAHFQHWPGIATAALGLPAPTRALAKLWWEQVVVPRAAAQLRADVLWIPYWAAPYRQPVPTVVTVHDVIPRLLPAYGGGGLARLYTRLVSATARRAAAVITVSDAAARDVVAELDLSAARVFAIHHGPNVAPGTTFAPNNLPPGELDPGHLDTVRQRYQLPTRYFLYMGGFDVRKNVSAVLNAYGRYLERGGDPAVKLVIAGRLPAHDSAFAPDPQKIAAELELHDAVRFCGWVADEDKPALYKMAVAFLFPSLYEGFGMPVLEAMQAGTAVVTSGR